MSSEQYTAAVAAFLVALAIPVFLKSFLTRVGVIDVPNSRSSHNRPVLRGGGLAQAIAIVVAMTYAAIASDGDGQSLLVIVLTTCVAAAALGWLEDLRGLPVKTRAATQLVIGVVATLISAQATDHSLLWIIIGGAALIGGINVVNFMDGVNGISALHGIVAGATFAVVGSLNDADWLITVGLVLAAAFAAFLPWNVSGRMFLGDVGSYLLGGMIAITITVAWMQGLPIIALAAPVVIYVGDTGVTLVSRIRAGEQWHEAHRDHTYQRLNRAGLPHLAVAATVAGASTAVSTLGLFAAETAGASRALLIVAALVVVLGYTFVRFVVPDSELSTNPKSNES